MAFANIEKRLQYADFLLDKYPSAAAKHLLAVANELLIMHLKLPGNCSVSPLLANKKLSAGSERERAFSVSYLELWKLAAKSDASKDEVLNVYKAVKSFLDLVKKNWNG